MKRTYEFEDEVPELLSTQKAVYGEEVPIVVDCGSHFTRVGFVFFFFFFFFLFFFLSFFLSFPFFFLFSSFFSDRVYRWGGEKDPRLSFQTLVGKGKTKSTSEENVFLGNTCLINSKKLVCRSPFDSNVIVRFDAYEVIHSLFVLLLFFGVFCSFFKEIKRNERCILQLVCFIVC